MATKHMTWDHALLKKFCNTGHFRLLNQVRSELKAQPLIRDQETRALSLQIKPLRGFVPRTPKRPNALDNQLTERSAEETETQDDSPKSFRDRLSAIDMR